jgi:hypothetical protein
MLCCAVSCCAAEAEVRREMAAEAGGDLSIPDVERFDSNIITPVRITLTVELTVFWGCTAKLPAPTLHPQWSQRLINDSRWITKETVWWQGPRWKV